ncbi:MAG: thermostable hemolysin [Candidatus Thiodiazotropha sp.]
MRSRRPPFRFKHNMPSRVHNARPDSPRRKATEDFVQQCFKKHYEADICHFMPNLMSLSDDQDRLQAVLGFRHAGLSPLFLETYLNHPVEQMIAARVLQPVDRSQLVEVGNLSVANPGIIRWLFIALTGYLSTTQCEWVLFTIGPVLQHAFERLGFQMIDLGEARCERLPEADRVTWGRYYDQQPRVLAGRLDQGLRTLGALCEKEVAIMHLWQNAAAMGREAA